MDCIFNATFSSHISKKIKMFKKGGNMLRCSVAALLHLILKHPKALK